MKSNATEGLTLRYKAKRKRRAALRRRERFLPSATSQVWSLDFVSDQLTDRWRFRALAWRMKPVDGDALLELIGAVFTWLHFATSFGGVDMLFPDTVEAE
jgi:transposase InsO family protein